MKLEIYDRTDIHQVDRVGEVVIVAKCKNALYAAYLLAAVRLAEEFGANHVWPDVEKCQSLIGDFVAARSRMEGV